MYRWFGCLSWVWQVNQKRIDCKSWLFASTFRGTWSLKSKAWTAVNWPVGRVRNWLGRTTRSSWRKNNFIRTTRKVFGGCYVRRWQGQNFWRRVGRSEKCVCWCFRLSALKHFNVSSSIVVWDILLLDFRLYQNDSSKLAYLLWLMLLENTGQPK